MLRLRGLRRLILLCSMYMSALNTVGVSDQKGGAKRGVRWEGAETLTASLQDVRIFLMPSDIAGIYNSRAELTGLAVAHTGPKSQQHTGNSGKNTKLCTYLQLHQFLLQYTIKSSETYNLTTTFFPSALTPSLCVLINHNLYKLYVFILHYILRLCVGAGWLGVWAREIS